MTADPITAADLPDRLEAALTERFTDLGNPFSRMVVHEKGPDGWPATHPVGPNRVAEVLRELLAAEAPQPETQARPAEHEWFVETRMLDGHWSKYGASRETAADGRELFERDTAGPGGAHAFRLVHATTSYAIEAEHEPDTETQDAPPVEPHPTEADLRHALAVLDRFHGRDAAPAAGSAEGAQSTPSDAVTRVTDHTHTGPAQACDTQRFGETCGRPAGEHQMRDDEEQQ